MFLNVLIRIYCSKLLVYPLERFFSGRAHTHKINLIKKFLNQYLGKSDHIINGARLSNQTAHSFFFGKSYNRYVKVTLSLYDYFTDPNEKCCYGNDFLLFFSTFTFSFRAWLWHNMCNFFDETKVVWWSVCRAHQVSCISGKFWNLNYLQCLSNSGRKNLMNSNNFLTLIRVHLGKKEIF